MKKNTIELETQILIEISELAEENDGIASVGDYLDSNRTPNIDTILSVFGSWNHAVESAGYETLIQNTDTEIKLSELKKQTLIQISELAEENDGVASMREYVDSGREPNLDEIIATYGSWTNAIKNAEYEPYIKLEVSLKEEDILREIRQYYEENNGLFSVNDYQSHYGNKNVKKILTEFGTWDNALHIAGINIQNQHEDFHLQKQILTTLKELYTANKPSYLSKKTYVKSKLTPSIKHVLNQFGTWSNALLHAGLPIKEIKQSNEEIDKNTTEKEIIQQLNKFGDSYTGKITIESYHYSGRIPSVDTILHHFGTWQHALKSAGIYQDMKSIETPEDEENFKKYAVKQLQKYASELDKSIKMETYKKSGRLPTITTILNVFETWSNALDAAGIQLSTPNANRYAGKDDLKQRTIKQINEFFKETNSTSESLYKQSDRKPSATTIRRLCGSWTDALELAGITEEKRKSQQEIKIQKTKEEIIKKLRDFFSETGVTSEDLYKKQRRSPSATTIRRVFGSWQEVLIEANLLTTRQLTMIKAIKDFYNETGFISERLYKKHRRSPSASTIVREFGSWKLALKAAGFSENEQMLFQDKNIKKIKNDMLQALKDFYKETGVTSQRLYKAEERQPSSTSIVREFDSWKLSLKEAGFSEKQLKVTPTNSKKCMAYFLKKFYKETGSTLESDYKEKGLTPAPSSFIRLFGSWENALKYAGLKGKQLSDTFK